MKKGFIICISLGFLSALILIIYTFDSSSLNTYYIGFALFKLSCYFVVEFIVCGLVVDAIKKQC